MNTLLFISGMGIGALATTVLILLCLILFIRKTTKGAQDENRRFSQATIELMAERNEIDKKLLSATERIAELLDPNRSIITPS